MKGQARILLVEDEAIVARDLQQTLTRLGYEVPLHVASGAEALEGAAAIQPNLALMDIHLSGEMDGITAAEHLRRQFDIPVIYLTALSDEVTLQRAGITEPFAYLIKPFETRELYMAIETALYRHAAERKLKQMGQWLATALASIGDAVIATDPHGVIIFMNPMAERLTGWREAEALGRDLAGVFVLLAEHTSRPRIENPVVQVRQAGIAIWLDAQTLILTRLGVKLSIEGSAAPIRDERGDISSVVVIFRDITWRKRSEEQLRHQVERLRTLHDIDASLTPDSDLSFALKLFLMTLTAQAGVEAVNLWLFNPSQQTLECVLGYGSEASTPRHTRRRLDEKSRVGQAVLERRLVHLPAETRPGVTRPASFPPVKGLDYYAVPLIARDQVKGVLEIFCEAPLVQEEAGWLDFLGTLAEAAAIAIDNAELFEKLQRSNAELTLARDALLEGWSRALNWHNRESEDHLLRLAEFTAELAQALGLKDTELMPLRWGARLHDSGALGIPPNILFKPGELTPAEWTLVRQHPVYAYDMLSPIDYLQPVLEIPYCHHEKWDGTGYPRGLKGEQIPLAARIFAVVDVWQALGADRPYRAGWPEEKVRDYLQAQAGAHFDPHIVNVFFKMLEATRR